MKFALAILAALALSTAAPTLAQAAPPAGVTGIALDGRVELAWQPAVGAADYAVYRGTSATSLTTRVSITDALPPGVEPATSSADIGVVNGTTYYYAVRAIIGGVESANSRVVRVRPVARTCSAGNPVTRENCYPGSSTWDIRGDTSVEGFATEQSIDHGGSVGIKVRSTAAFDIEIYRSGYYGATGGRLFSTILGVPAATQPGCVSDATTGLLDCANWAVSETITTSASWPSGVYLLRLVRADGGQNLVMFVVRDDARQSDILYGLPFTTYQAYNDWGGKSLYDTDSTGANTVTGRTRAAKVSFDRPFKGTTDTGRRDWYTRTDYATVSWLERSGYDVAYASVSDLERNGARLRDHVLYLSGAHDEYVSSAMRTAMEQAREAGTDLFFTGSNEVYWKVRFEPSPVSARTDRVLVCYKSTQSGGTDPSGIPTGTWRDPVGANQPENALSGHMYVGDKDFTYFPLRVSAAEGADRIWRYTGLDTQAPGTAMNVGTSIVGWEWDSRVDNGREPTGVKTLASSPATGQLLADAGRTYVPGSALSTMVKYTAASGALVVATGTNHWNWGLARQADDLGEPNVRIQQATVNILADMGTLPETPAAGLILDDPTAPPSIISRTPGSNETGVGTATKVRVTFSRAMDASTLTNSTFTLQRPDNSTVLSSVSYDAATLTATLTPSSPLASSTTYAARLSSGIKAANGIAIPAQSWSFTTRPPDTTPPSVAITAPVAGADLSGTVTVTANASDDAEVSSVQFKVDGADLGGEIASSPYAVDWNTATAPNGRHTLTAVARDSSGNTATSSAVGVTVDSTGLVGAYGFEETSGTAVTDSSGKGNGGTISGGATRTASGRFGRAISYDGIDDVINIADSASLDLTNGMTLSAWVRPTALGTVWRTVMLKEQPGNLVYALYANNDAGRPSGHAFTTADRSVQGSGGLAANAWTHLAVTYNGTNLTLFVNGTQTTSQAIGGSMITSTGALRIGNNTIWNEPFSGIIDEVRVYRRAESAAEIQADMARAVQPEVADTQPPTAPGGLVATGGLGENRLSWTAASDNVGVVRYHVHRSTTSGFTPSAGNEVATPTGTSYTDAGLTAGTYYYRVTAEDAAGNVSPASAQASGTATADTTGPTVSITAPTSGTTVQGTVSVTADAADAGGVAGVQFQVDDANLGAETASAPYSIAWDTAAVSNGTHRLAAVARDASGNRTTSTVVTVTVLNQASDPSGLVAAYGFEELSGTLVEDVTGRGHTGTISGATRTTTGRNGRALAFDGVNDWVTIADEAALDLTTGMTLEAWVNPTANNDWRTAIIKERPGDMSYALYSGGPTVPNGAITTSGTSGYGEAVGPAGSAPPVNVWTHVAATYDGSVIRLYRNGTQIAAVNRAGSINVSTGELRLGGNSVWGEFFAGQIDDVRIYSTALAAAQIQADMATAVGSPAPPDSEPPSAPSSPTVTSGIGENRLSWPAAIDNVGVVRYRVYRSTTSGFTPGSGNQIATPTGTSYADTGLAAGTYYYRVAAEDAAGNVSTPSPQVSGTAQADTTPPAAPATLTAGGGANVAQLSWTAASDNVGVVRYHVHRSTTSGFTPSAGNEVATPTGTSYTDAGLTAGTYYYRVTAEDAAGNVSPASPQAQAAVTAQDTSGLVAAYGFEETSGNTITDSSTGANNGTLVGGAARTTAGRFGRALSFDGIDDMATVPDATSLDLTTAMTLEAWVRPTSLGGWRTALLKEQSGNLVYALYATSTANRPAGHAYTTTDLDARATSALAANTWTHLAATYDGATIRLYVNGTQVATRTTSGPIVTSSGALRIGGNGVWGEYFTGQIDEVRVYRRTLPTAEIAADMNRAVL